MSKNGFHKTEFIIFGYHAHLKKLSSHHPIRILCIFVHLAAVVKNLKRLHWLPVQFCCISKTATLVYKFLYGGHSSYFGSLFLLVVENIIQDTTVQIIVFWRFLNSIHLYINKKKTQFRQILPQFGNDLPFYPNFHLFQKKGKILSLQESFPTLAHNPSIVSVALDLVTSIE